MSPAPVDVLPALSGALERKLPAHHLSIVYFDGMFSLRASRCVRFFGVV